MMIHLDTCVLIELTLVGSPIAMALRKKIKQGEILLTSAVAWSEFCNGPLSVSQKELIFSILDQRITDFTWVEAEEAVRLFNLSGRKRGSHADCMIAAAAMISGCSLATLNTRDFKGLVPHGLTLEKID